MFKYKNAMISMAVVAMLAACGGGGSDHNGGGSGDDNSNPTGNGKVISDANLSGAAVALSDPAIIVPQDATSIAVPYAAFNSKEPRVADPDTPAEQVGKYGTFTDQPWGEASPLRLFGVRVVDDGAQPDDSKPGRLVFHLQDNDGVVAAQRENLSIEIDKVVTKRTAGEITVELGEGAQVHVSARNSTGQESGAVSIPATADMITIVDPADTETNDIILNVDAIVAAAVAAAPAGNAKTVLGSAKDFSSTAELPFAVSMSLTNADFSSGGTATTGASNVKVGTRDTVSGEGGVSGYVQSVKPAADPAAGGTGG